MHLVRVDVQVRGPGPHLAECLILDVRPSLLSLVRVVIDSLSHRDEEVLYLPLLVGLSALVPVGDSKRSPFAVRSLERHHFRTVVQRLGAAAVPQQHARCVDVLSDDDEFLR